MRTLLLVASHYHNAIEVHGFVQHLAELTRPEGWAIRLALSDNSMTLCPPLDPRVNVYRSGKNLGYLGGAEYALQTWIFEHGTVPEWIGIVNTDLEFDREFFCQLLLEPRDAVVAVVAPAIELPDGTPQNPFAHSRPVPARMNLMRAVHRSRVLSQLWLLGHLARNAARRDAPTRPARRRIYAPYGAAVFLRRTFFAAGGTLRYGAFMFGEEFHIAEQVRRRGLAVEFDPDCKVEHRAHAVTASMPGRRVRRWKALALDHLCREYFAPDWAGLARRLARGEKP